MTDEDEVRLVIPLPTGEVHVSGAYGRPSGAWATFAVAPGAGSGHAHPFLVGLTAALRAQGIATLRFQFPYREAGRRMPGPVAHAIATWSSAVALCRARAADAEPVWAGGRSYGGRMASMAAAEGAIDPAGLVYLGYPLHPPGRPDKARTAHLPGIRAPQLFMSGTNDAFVDPHAQLEQAVHSCIDATLVWIEGGGHSFEVKGRRRAADDIVTDLAPLVAGFLREHR